MTRLKEVVRCKCHLVREEAKSTGVAIIIFIIIVIITIITINIIIIIIIIRYQISKGDDGEVNVEVVLGTQADQADDE